MTPVASSGRQSCDEYLSDVDFLDCRPPPETFRAGNMPGGLGAVKCKSLACGHAEVLQLVQSGFERQLPLQQQRRFHLPIIAQRPQILQFPL